MAGLSAIFVVFGRKIPSTPFPIQLEAVSAIFSPTLNPRYLS